jgi:hypothetical protein
MSTATFAAASGPAAAVGVHVRTVTPVRVLNSEWIKMRSLRSTAWTLLAAVVTMVAVGWIFGWASNVYWSDMSPDEKAMFNPIDTTLAGYTLAQLAVGVLGVLLVTGEYATGQIRATFGAVPQRLPVLWAKATLYAGVTFALMTVAAFISFLGGQQLLGTHGTDLSASGAVKAMVGVAGYLTLIAVFAVAVGFIVRSTAGGVAFLFGLLLVLPTMGMLLPASWEENILPYLPSNAGASMFSTQVTTGSLSAGASLLVLVAWIAGALALAGVLLKQRDA